jgi:hypothetical protein
MTVSDLEMLKGAGETPLKLVCRDGEAVIALGAHRFRPGPDIIYDLISTSNSGRYEMHDEQPAYFNQVF